MKRPRRRGRDRPRRAAAACAVPSAMLAATLAAVLAVQPSRALAATLECDGIRRLSDNYLLDLRVRLVFDSVQRRYRRFENGGRGWEEVATSGTYRTGRGERLILAENPYVISYVERLTGAYYYIDSTGATLSVWGHCAASGPPRSLF